MKISGNLWRKRMNWISGWWWTACSTTQDVSFSHSRIFRRTGKTLPTAAGTRGSTSGGTTPYNDGFGYEAWRNCFELVNLNLWEPKVREYLLDVIGFWIDEFDIDGIRLDCADCLEFSFMEDMRRFTNDKKKDFWLMGEVIHGDYSRYVKPEMLDSVTNYELHKGLYSGHNDHNYFEIAHTIRREFDATAVSIRE